MRQAFVSLLPPFSLARIKREAYRSLDPRQSSADGFAPPACAGIYFRSRTLLVHTAYGHGEESHHVSCRLQSNSRDSDGGSDR